MCVRRSKGPGRNVRMRGGGGDDIVKILNESDAVLGHHEDKR